ncbi:hypothetical protein ERICIV_02259 [Paenibacillus larvae subsp. larvae]|nr:hypothetical protein [Paenibacillus larvae]YP_010082375.1 hypothetical protein KMD19_gp31 [Paenibacillus phage Scottie]AQT83280.1 hypothetical protein B1222_00430 [Paenibacillus larvae subsp. pulvifaciens]AQZ48398.1 hypothetical protein B5S25_19190 [Paenibacillus larvae subsp. pulvifaciens]AVF26399.1 hypothetical protein ERICIII_02238 [Paenibacillus larvae subsp. larvae]AVF31176.1 hypothetical protein ERICIV_02259 [Paenibacillus larvae subsp. larvae]AXF40896.1 hypothetical protein SCOTTIE_
MKEVIKVNRFTKKQAGIVGFALLFIVIGLVFFYIGRSSASHELDGKALTIANVQKETEEANAKLKEASDAYKEIEDKFKGAKVVIDIANTRKSDADRYQKEAEKYEKLAGEKKAELDKIESAIKEKKEAPIVLPAGNLTGGKDIPAGRYKVTKAGSRGSNFIINTASGDLKVSTIIHGGDHGVSEYIATIDSGDLLECHASFKFTPVE